MGQTLDHKPRILEEAAVQLRQYGYAKTTLADIARGLGMSPANVYRFFGSKTEIIETLARQWLGEVEQVARDISAATDIPSDEKIVRYIIDIHDKSVERFLEDGRAHDVVTKVCEQHTHVVLEHVHRMQAILSQIIADGTREGVFDVEDPDAMAVTICDAMVKFFHPNLIEMFFTADLRARAEQVGRLLTDAIRAQPCAEEETK